jgi:hypothetical protein
MLENKRKMKPKLAVVARVGDEGWLARVGQTVQENRATTAATLGGAVLIGAGLAIAGRIREADRETIAWRKGHFSKRENPTGSGVYLDII